MLWNHEIRMGMAGGTLLSALVQFKVNNLLETIVCAAIGAIVSYLVTLLLKRLLK